MVHYMNLNPQPFALIAQGQKTIELRLKDEKRQKIAIGDIIVFSCGEQTMRTQVLALHPFADFEELYRNLPLDQCGYLPEELLNASPKDMEVYYSPEQQKKYGVLGIEIERIE